MKPSLRNGSIVEGLRKQRWLKVALLVLVGAALGFLAHRDICRQSVLAAQEARAGSFQKNGQPNATAETLWASTGEHSDSSGKEITDTVTLVITTLTLFVSIAVPLFGVDFITNYISGSGREVAEQTGEHLQADLNRIEAMILLLFQFDKEAGWKRKTEVNYGFERQVLVYGELALVHALKQESYLKDAAFKLDFEDRFSSSTSKAMRNNLLFSLSLINATGVILQIHRDQADALNQLREEKQTRAFQLMREMEKTKPTSGSWLLTEVRAELNYFDLWHKRKTRKDRLKIMEKKLEKAALLLREQELPAGAKAGLSNQSLPWCQSKLQEIREWVASPHVEIWDETIQSTATYLLQDVEEAMASGQFSAEAMVYLRPWNSLRSLQEVLA